MHHNCHVPTLHRFGNCVIRIYANDPLPPHFHIGINDSRECLIEIDSLKPLAGRVKGARRRVARPVEAIARKRVCFADLTALGIATDLFGGIGSEKMVRRLVHEEETEVAKLSREGEIPHKFAAILERGMHGVEKINEYHGFETVAAWGLGPGG